MGQGAGTGTVSSGRQNTTQKKTQNPPRTTQTRSEKLRERNTRCHGTAWACLPRSLPVLRWALLGVPVWKGGWGARSAPDKRSGLGEDEMTRAILHFIPGPPKGSPVALWMVSVLVILFPSEWNHLSGQHGCDGTSNGGQLKCKNTWCFIGTLLYRASWSSSIGAASASWSFKENRRNSCVSFSFRCLPALPGCLGHEELSWREGNWKLLSEQKLEEKVPRCSSSWLYLESRLQTCLLMQGQHLSGYYGVYIQ